MSIQRAGFPVATKEMRRIRKERINKCLYDDYRQKAKKEREEVKIAAHQKMMEVVYFFEEVYPQDITPDLMASIEEPFKMGTKSQYGMIVLIDKLIRWPAWKPLAFKRFNINIKI